jgi:NADH:ubiquinone oxidoreductase subunit 2 (subunit N)
MAFPDLVLEWSALLAVIAGITMTVGNLVALRQRSLKRLLAYSSIAHAGYALIGMVAADFGGWEATVYYLMAYSLMTVASFGVVLVATGGTDNQYTQDSIDALKGFGWRHPVLGFVLTVALLSLGGFPPTAGFFGKLYLFKAGVTSGHIALVVVAAINSLISLYYYLAVLVTMYFALPERAHAGGEHGHEHGHGDEVFDFPAEVLPARTIGTSSVLTIATAGTLLLGILSGTFFGYSTEAARSLNAAGKNVQFVTAHR